MEFTQEQVRKAMECKTADELIALAKSEGVELTREEAEEYIDKLQSREITFEELAQVAGGRQKMNTAASLYDTMAVTGASGECENYDCGRNCSCEGRGAE